MADQGSQSGLTALAWTGSGDWLDAVQRRLKELGLAVEKRQRVLRAWNARKRRTAGAHGVEFADGWNVRRVWISPRRWVVGVTPSRFFFLPGAEEPADHPFHELLNGRPPPRQESAEGLLRTAVKLTLALGESADLSNSLVSLDGAVLPEGLVRRVVGDQTFTGRESPHPCHFKHGYHGSPNRARVAVVPLGDVSIADARAFRDLVRAALKERHVEHTVNAVNPASLRARIAEGGFGDGASVVFLLPAKGEEDKLDLSLLRSAEQAELPFRRAYRDDPWRYSVKDQIGSIVTACGGVPFALSLDVGRDTPWSVGIDLSHRTTGSCLCVTLVDPDGVLQGAWRGHQELNERADEALLSHLLSLSSRAVGEVDSGPGAVIFRDGRWPDGVDRDYVFQAFGKAVSLVEVRKRGNPLIWTGPNYTPPPSDFWGRHDAQATSVFLSPEGSPKAGGSGRVIKLAWNRSDDRLDLGAGGIVAMALGGRYGSTLGVRIPSLPAALYWADGIAGASDADLRFRGQRIVDVGPRSKTTPRPAK